MATCAWRTRERFPAGPYAMEIADINHFFNQCKGNGKSATTKSLHEARVQVICAELNTFQKRHRLPEAKQKSQQHGRLLLLQS